MSVELKISILRVLKLITSNIYVLLYNLEGEYAQEYIYLQESNQNGVLGLNADVFKEIIKIQLNMSKDVFYQERL